MLEYSTFMQQHQNSNGMSNGMFDTGEIYGADYGSVPFQDVYLGLAAWLRLQIKNEKSALLLSVFTRKFMIGVVRRSVWQDSVLHLKVELVVPTKM